MCSVIGDEPKGDTFLDLLKEQGLSQNGIVKSKERITTTKFRVIGNNTQMIRVDEEVDANISDVESEILFEGIKKLIEEEKINVIIFEDYDKGVITKHLIAKVAEHASKMQLKVVADPKRRNFKDYKKYYSL